MPLKTIYETIVLFNEFVVFQVYLISQLEELFQSQTAQCAMSQTFNLNLLVLAKRQRRTIVLSKSKIYNVSSAKYYGLHIVETKVYPFRPRTRSQIQYFLLPGLAKMRVLRKKKVRFKNVLVSNFAKALLAVNPPVYSLSPKRLWFILFLVFD
ncbi:hypothetical protein BY458DRAFT_488387 [Sporodiniella umbellata]|nr:hypothetical protein BY458DRAFT_488387 [Sporodiniella umbellata]